jgi:hypothetical protein
MAAISAGAWAGMTDPGSMAPSAPVTPGEDPGSISNG